MDSDALAAGCQAICQSGKFDWDGRCAPICYEFMGDKPKKCAHAVRVHGELAEAVLSVRDQAQNIDPADELEATIKTDRVANVRYYYSMETFAVTLRDGRQGQSSTIRAAIDSANQRKAS